MLSAAGLGGRCVFRGFVYVASCDWVNVDVFVGVW